MCDQKTPTEAMTEANEPLVRTNKKKGAGKAKNSHGKVSGIGHPFQNPVSLQKPWIFILYCIAYLNFLHILIFQVIQCCIEIARY